MESILRELFFGNVSPVDKFYGTTLEVRQARKAYMDLMDPFEEQLRRHDLFKEHEAVYSAQSQYQLETEAEIFSQAFCMGARVMLEVLAPHMVF